MKIKKICGREFEYYEEGEPGVVHASGIYRYKNRNIALEWIDVGWDDRWGEYHETTVRRWVIIGERPYYQHNFTSITKAADYLDKITRW
jgi:hypothetical protein